VCEPPNKRLYTFSGRISIGSQTIAVDNDAVLLRGAHFTCFTALLLYCRLHLAAAVALLSTTTPCCCAVLTLLALLVQKYKY
jgi:hypothetical protein